MPAPQISTDGVQVRAYASTAETELGKISTALSQLVDDCLATAYWGQNGVAFKTKTATAATDMSQAIWTAIDKFTTAVNDANKKIANSLGGDVTIDGVPKPTVTVPKIDPTGPKGETGEGLYPQAMEDLKANVDARAREITAAATAHQNALTRQTPDWQGNQKDIAVGACATLTESITSAITDGFGEINNAITAQNEATAAADA